MPMILTSKDGEEWHHLMLHLCSIRPTNHHFRMLSALHVKSLLVCGHYVNSTFVQWNNLTWHEGNLRLVNRVLHPKFSLIPDINSCWSLHQPPSCCLPLTTKNASLVALIWDHRKGVVSCIQGMGLAPCPCRSGQVCLFLRVVSIGKNICLHIVSLY